MAQDNLDMVVLKDKKFTYGVYTCKSAGYSVVSMGTLIRHCSRVTAFYRVMPRFSVKAMQQFGNNVIRFRLIKGEQKWYIVGF